MSTSEGKASVQQEQQRLQNEDGPIKQVPHLHINQTLSNGDKFQSNG